MHKLKNGGILFHDQLNQHPTVRLLQLTSVFQPVYQVFVQAVIETSFQSHMPVPPGDLYNWHARPGAFARLQPPWQKLEILGSSHSLGDGARVTLCQRLLGVPLTWEVEHHGHLQGERFCDRQLRGPFRSWQHEHRFDAAEDGSELMDRLQYSLPLGRIGNFLGGGLAKSELDRVFRYRHEVTRQDLAFWKSWQHNPRFRIVMTGGTGLVGASLQAFLSTQGHEVVNLSRRNRPGWPGDTVVDFQQTEPPAELLGADVVIHLAGANIASGRWSKSRRDLLWSSRVETTRRIVSWMKRMARPPKVFLCASATGYYGAATVRAATENSPQGEGFLASLCAAWEDAAKTAADLGIRVLHLRTGVVLSPAGGALAKMLPVFRVGLGGSLGSGDQYMPWIAMDDLVRAILFLINREEATGPINMVAPPSVRMSDFARTLGRVLRRPAIFPVPGPLLRLLLGQMAEETILLSARVRPSRLEELGFSFQYPDLEEALRHLLGRTNGTSPTESSSGR